MKYILFAICAALIIYEIVALLDKQPGDTISEWVWYLSNRPLVPFVFGLVCGHFFWQKG